MEIERRSLAFDRFFRKDDQQLAILVISPFGPMSAIGTTPDRFAADVQPPGSLAVAHPCAADSVRHAALPASWIRPGYVLHTSSTRF